MTHKHQWQFVKEGHEHQKGCGCSRYPWSDCPNAYKFVCECGNVKWVNEQEVNIK